MEPYNAAARRVADARTQRLITATDAAATATANAAADASDLALGLGGPAFASCAAAAAGRLARHVAAISEQFAAIADVLRDINIHSLRGRYEPLPGDYVRDVLGHPDYHAPPVCGLALGHHVTNPDVIGHGVISAVLPGHQLYPEGPPSRTTDHSLHGDQPC